ncbi:MAG: tandem-95 repeat protein [Alphaproteobacteria bacterium]|nr:tandem-95 repeat protein [Alphaproteobacteria bacterium]
MTPLVAVLAFACTPPPEHRAADGTPLPDAPIDLGALHRLAGTSLAFIEHPLVPGLEPSWQARAGLARVYANERGLTVVDRRHSDPEWTVGLEVTGWGRGGGRRAPGPASVWTDQGLFEAVHDDLVEVLEQRDDEIEHRFRLLRDPGGGGAVTLDLRVTGAKPYPLSDGATFVIKGRARVDWRELLVRDRRGRTLDAFTEVDGDVLRLVVDVDGAEWPIEVDPMLTVFEASAGPGVGSGNSLFGWSIAADGDRLLVGDPRANLRTDGSGFILERNQGGEDHWGFEQELSPATAVHVGQAVAMEGSVAVVASDEARTAWVYGMQAGGWVLEETAAQPAAEEYGASVAITREMVYIGSPGFSDGVSDAGRVYQYQPNYDYWWWYASPWPTERGRFGTAVSASGDWLLVGAPGVGGVALFNARRLVAPTWTQTAPGSDLGTSVAIAGDVAAASAPSLGVVRTYRRRVGTDRLEQTSTIEAPPTAVGTFGDRIAMTTDTLVALDHPLAPGMAKVHLFERRDGDQWAWVESFDAGVTDGSPLSVSLRASVLAVGVPDEGVAHVWRRSGTGWSEDVRTSTRGAQFGSAVAVSGDLVVVGAKSSDVGGSDAGAVTLFRRDAPGSWSQVVEKVSATPNERYGTAVDVDGDIVVVGAPGVGGGRVDAMLFDGDSLASAIQQPTTTEDRYGFGQSLDVDGELLVVGDPSWVSYGLTHVFERFASLGGDSYVSEDLVAIGNTFGDHIGLESCVWGDWTFASSADAAGGNGEVHIRHYPSTFPSTQVATPMTYLVGVGGEGLGTSLAADGGVLAVGSSGVGRVRLYTLTPTATWALRSTLNGPGDFGAAVALRGDDLFVGAPSSQLVQHRRRNQGGTDAWGVVETWSGTGNQRFGATLSFDDTTLVIGEPGVNASSDGTVHLIELGANLPPVANDDRYTTEEDVPLDVPVGAGVLENDHDPMGTLLTATVVAQPSHGHVVLAPDGGFRYTPDENYEGTDSFVYAAHSDVGSPTNATVDIVVTPVNDLPVAANDFLGGIEDELVVGDVLANDWDVESPDDLRAVLVQDVAEGTLMLEENGTFTYLGARDQFGVVTFTYVAVDPDHGISFPATVTIALAPSNDPPIVHASVVPVDVDEDGSIRGSHGVGLLDPQIVEDPDGDDLTATLQTPTTHGSVRVETDGSWGYVPAPDFVGQDSFTYVADDGTTTTEPITVRLTVRPVDDPPIGVADGPFQTLEDNILHIDASALLRNDIDPDSVVLTARLDPVITPTLGTVSFDSLTNDFIYSPQRDVYGTDHFTYRAVDNENAVSAPVLVTVTIVPVNDAPVARDDDAGEVRSTVSGAVLENDSDAEGDALNAELVSAPLGGTVVLQPDGTFTYTAEEGFVGADGFRYVARDGAGASSAPALVSLVVLPSGEGPTGPTDTGCQELEWFADADGDGFGDPEISVRGCDAPPSHVLDDTDCDDTRAGSHPGAKEIQDDGLDQDCDGLDNGIRTPGACDTAPSGSSALLLAALALSTTRRRRQR